jgi:hypothetical protein
VVAAVCHWHAVMREEAARQPVSAVVDSRPEAHGSLHDSHPPVCSVRLAWCEPDLAPVHSSRFKSQADERLPVHVDVGEAVRPLDPGSLSANCPGSARGRSRLSMGWAYRGFCASVIIDVMLQAALSVRAGTTIDSIR